MTINFYDSISIGNQEVLGANGAKTTFTSPTNYTPADNDVTSHLQAMDTALGTIGKTVVKPDQNSSFTLNVTFNNSLIPMNTSTQNLTVNLVSGLPDNFNCVLYNLGTNDVIINLNGQTLRARGTNIVNDNASASLLYDAVGDIWYGVGDLS